MSRRIAALEAELGVALFTRTARRVELTDAGAELLGDARETLAAAQRLGRRARVMGRGGMGAVSVGFLWSTLGGYLAPLVAAAAERHHQIELTVSQLRYVDLAGALRRGDADLVIGRGITPAPGVSLTVLNCEPSMVAVPAQHPLAAREAITLPDLHGETVVSLAAELIPQPFAAEAAVFASHEVVPADHRGASSPSEALALVAAGLGIYYRLAASAVIPMPGVVYRELEAMPMRTLLARRLEPPSPAVAAIARLATELFVDAPHASNDARGTLVQALAGP